ncbi:hypothetical protein [Bradyrhizobium ivorense]|uniref:hypothetical protein n=1 Tax=Bradyrhizobium ivorense TaxID=2511166 RepID=UPI0010BB7528|nr:hypothetical protein [Bradyrhizobium ivorense]MCC8936428.1 hypothetical protein [Bradyrhizobium ivorense]VIO74042.1 hypothetical protein CI41S_41530 [Bradyrhizobium ivorense]
MDSKIDFASIIVAVCVAGYAAIMLAYVAQNDLGLSAVQTRHLSMITALVLALPLALDFVRSPPDETR